MTAAERLILPAGAVITGAGSGIGAALARAVAGPGAPVVLADVDLPAAGRVAAQVGGRAVHTDVAVPEQVEALAAGPLRLAGCS